MESTDRPPQDLIRANALGAFRSPSSVFLRGDDAIRLTTFNGASGVIVTLEGRWMTDEGEVKDFAVVSTPNTDRSTHSDTFALSCGWLLSLQLRASSGSPRVGQCFALVELVKGLGSIQTPIATLMEGYVTDTSRLAWPGSLLTGSTSGAGVLRSITGTDPAANAEVSETVPTNARWRLYSLDVTLVTDGNAGNREVALTIDDGATVLARVPSGFTHAASLTKLYSFFRGGFVNTAAQDLTRLAPLPLIDLQGGFRIKTVTTNIQATDNYGAPQLLVEEWIED